MKYKELKKRLDKGIPTYIMMRVGSKYAGQLAEVRKLDIYGSVSDWAVVGYNISVRPAGASRNVGVYGPHHDEDEVGMWDTNRNNDAIFKIYDSPDDLIDNTLENETVLDHFGQPVEVNDYVYLGRTNKHCLGRITSMQKSGEDFQLHVKPEVTEATTKSMRIVPADDVVKIPEEYVVMKILRHNYAKDDS